MMTIYAGRPTIELARLCYHADLPLLLYGRHGVGKSALLLEAARELKAECLVYDLSLMEPPDLIGLPWRRKGQTVYAPPASLPTSGKGFLVVEELNRAPEYMRAPCLQLLTARRLNDYVLPAGWLPVAAVNPPEDGYDASELDPALLSRFVRALVLPDRKEWLAWARGQGLHPDVLAYVESDASVFDTADSNPRAWTYVSALLSADDKGGVPRPTLRVAVSGLVGKKRQASFMAFVKDKVRPLDAEDVLDEYPSWRERIRTWAKKRGRLDLVRETLLAVMTQLQSEHLYRQVKRNRRRWRNLISFLGDLPGDLREEAERFFGDHGYAKPFSGRRRI
jgi:hypothetical protein